MNRPQFGLILFAAGLPIALLASSPSAEPEAAWDPREAQSPLFNRAASPPGTKGLQADAGGTVKRWEEFSTAPRASPPTFKPGQVLGVLLTSLMAPDEKVGSTLPAGCATSVIQNGLQAQGCSVFGGPPAINGGCSVSWTPPPNPNGTPNCSSTGGGQGNGGGTGQCSAGQGSPNNATTLCSVSGGSNNQGASTIACSASNFGNNTNALCSAVQGQNNSAGGSTCSVAAGSVNATCSTGKQAVPNGQGGSCSTTSAQGVGGSGGANVCSVKQGAGGSTCSSTGNGEICSAGANTGNNSDFCSVEFDSSHNNNCTALGGGACNATAGAPILSCSVKGQLKPPQAGQLCNSQVLPQ